MSLREGTVKRRTSLWASEEWSKHASTPKHFWLNTRTHAHTHTKHPFPSVELSGVAEGEGSDSVCVTVLMLPVEVGVVVGVGHGVAVAVAVVEPSRVVRSKYWLRMSERRKKRKGRWSVWLASTVIFIY